MTKLSTRVLGLDVGLVAVAAGSAYYGLVPLAPIAILIAELYRRTEGVALKQYLLDKSPRWLGGIAFAMLVALQPQALTKAAFLLFYLAWLIWHEFFDGKQLAVAGLTQLLVLWAIFLAAGIWHWPVILVIPAAYGSSYLLAAWLLAGQRASQVLALSWGLIVAEASWVFSVWLVNYIVLKGYGIIPQPAVVITALGYCFGGIYKAHAESKLSRGRLAEYLVIGFILILIVVAGTKWSGAI